MFLFTFKSQEIILPEYTHIHTHTHTLTYTHTHTYIYILSSSCRAASTDIPDPLSPLLPIVHRQGNYFDFVSLFDGIFVQLHYKNTTLSFLFEGSKSAMWERDRDEGPGHRLMEDWYIDLIFNHVLSLYSRPYVLASLTIGSRTSWLPESLLTVTYRSLCGHPCIYNFITPTRSFLFLIHVICLYPRIDCFPVITLFT